MFQRKRVAQISFILIVLVLLALFTAAAQAQDDGTAGCIHGMVWTDPNHNGLKDAGEDALDGSGVTLLEVAPFVTRQGRFNVGPLRLVDHVLAEDGGTFEFCNLREATYQVRVKPNEYGVRAKLVTISGSNPSASIPFAVDGEAVVNFGFGEPFVINSTDTLNQP